MVQRADVRRGEERVGPGRTRPRDHPPLRELAPSQRLILSWQRVAGNAAVCQALSHHVVQRRGPDTMRSQQATSTGPQASDAPPVFEDLPEAVQKELVDMGLDYTYMQAKPTQRLCFLNIWAKMKTDGLWAWVAEVRFTTEPGQLTPPQALPDPRTRDR